ATGGGTRCPIPDRCMPRHSAARCSIATLEGMNLQGRNALRTGSAQGIGQAIAVKMAEKGADIVINYRKNASGGEETGQKIREMGRRCTVIQADVGKIADARRLVEQATTALGPIDILVNNAGIEKRGSFVDITEDDYRAVIE